MTSTRRISQRAAWKWIGTGLLALLLAANVQAASVELWPSERRANNTLYSYGDEMNAMLITLHAQDYGPHKWSQNEAFAGPVVLTVDLPEAVTLLGVHQQGRTEVVSDWPTTRIEDNGQVYQRVRITLDVETLNQRLVQNAYYYRVYVWYESPATLDSQVRYQLHHGEQSLAAGHSRLVTAGTLQPQRALPEHFRFYPYGIYSVVPAGDYDRMADFYARFGIAGIESHWQNGLPASDDGSPNRFHQIYAANRRHGVLNLANMTLFARKHGRGYSADPEVALQRGGLVAMMDELTQSLVSEAARADWRAAHEHFDMAFWDWEPRGPQAWPGYDDQASIDAFASQMGIQQPLTGEQVAKEYRDAYARFRMAQIARPLYAVKQVIDEEGPMPFRVEQGSGATANIAYDVYGHDFEALTPMIYQAPPVRYARNLLQMLENTSVPAAKFWPDLTVGWASAAVFRESPREFLMDTVVTAAAGCGSLSHWPGIFMTDASWLGIHDGLAMIAPLEDFYRLGQTAPDVAVQGLAYRQQHIELGPRTMTLSSPDWNASLISFAHEHDGEQLVTLLNYHDSEDVFVRIASPTMAGGYLVHPAAGQYQQLDDAGSGMVQVRAMSPGLWVLTRDTSRIAGLEQLAVQQVQADYRVARDAYLAGADQSEVQLGQVGDIDLNYGAVDFGGQEQVVLTVRTPDQSVAIGSSGGRIYGWQPGGQPELQWVAGDDFGTDGLGMDMLWLPAGGRWSGDETQEMTLVSAVNDGHQAVIIYEASLDRSYPGVRMRKTYRIPAAGRDIHVELTFTNELVDETPVSLSYWSHHVLAQQRAHLVTPKLHHPTDRGQTTIFPARDLPADLKREVLMPERIVAEIDPIYAEYFPDTHSGIIFQLPDNLLNLYRWSSVHSPKHGSEWMTRPITLAAGNTATVTYTMTAVTGTSPGALQQTMQAMQDQQSVQADPANLLPHPFVIEQSGPVPDGWQTNVGSDHDSAVKVVGQIDNDGQAVVVMQISESTNVFLDTASRVKLDPQDDYMLVVQVKVDDMHYQGDWYRQPAGVRLYVYGTNNKHVWLAIHGQGSTDGWVTAVLPFPRDDNTRSDFSASRIMLRCYNMTGQVAFKNPAIVKRPQGVEVTRSFMDAHGNTIAGSHLQLYP